MKSDTFSAIQTALKEAFQPLEMNISDESSHHKGHAEAKKSGGGHLTVLLVSKKFAGVSLKDRHRLVYDAIWSSDRSFPVHALSLKTLTPQEWKERRD